MVMVSLLVLLSMACTFNVRTFAPTVEVPTQSQPEIQTETPGPVSGLVLDGSDINYKGIRFTLDPALGSRLYVFEDVITLEGATTHNIRFALTPEEYCQTWCVMVYRIADFEQAFGTFVFPPAGYRGGAAVIFEAQKKTLALQNGSGDRGLETFGQDLYAVSNDALKYVFRGYSADKQYGIYVETPVHASNLPEAAPTRTTNFQDLEKYNQQAEQSMNALSPKDFAPNLDSLDALVASIQVETP